jgi:hypothetical protein
MEVVRCHEYLPDPTETRFAAQRVPTRGRFGKIGRANVGDHRVPFLRRQSSPQSAVLLLIPTAPCAHRSGRALDRRQPWGSRTPTSVWQGRGGSEEPIHATSAGSGRSCSDRRNCAARGRLGRLACRSREIECCLGKVDPMIVRYPCSFKCIDGCASIAACDVKKPERLGSLVDQDPVQCPIGVAMKRVIVVDDLAIGLPLLLEQRGSCFVRTLPPGSRRGRSCRCLYSPATHPSTQGARSDCLFEGPQ